MRFGCRRVSRLMVAGAAALLAAAALTRRGTRLPISTRARPSRSLSGSVGGGYDIYARLAAEHLDASCRATRR